MAKARRMSEIADTGIWECVGCGQEYPSPPSRCRKCGGCSFEPLRLRMSEIEQRRKAAEAAEGMEAHSDELYRQRPGG